jgi:hypothetical protein
VQHSNYKKKFVDRALGSDLVDVVSSSASSKEVSDSKVGDTCRRGVRHYDVPHFEWKTGERAIRPTLY